jgi:hypothetical protein
MAARLRAFAALAGLFIGGVDCAPAGAQTPPANAPQAEQVEEPEIDPPVAAPKPLPVSTVQPAPTGPPAPAATAAVTRASAAPSSRPAAAHPAKAHSEGPIATLPGFEMLPEGGSRLFVEMSQTVGVEEKKSQRTLTYVLRGTRVVHRNNENALVTVHFNTPVTRARLLPSGHDLLFSIDLRADATPTWKIVNESDGTATLQIDFPKGSFLPAGGVDDTAYSFETPRSPTEISPSPKTAASHAPRMGGSRSIARGQHHGVAPVNPPPVGE